MRFSLPNLMRTTTFRLALLHSVLFTIFVLGLLVYLYSATVVFVRAEAGATLDVELSELLQVYDDGGLVQLNRSVRERSTPSLPGSGSRQLLYLLQDPAGRKISGQLSGLQRLPPESLHKLFIDIDYPTPDGGVESREAEGRAAVLPDGSTVFVGYDIQEIERVLPRITSVLLTAVPIGLLMSLLGGIIISRSAARRADQLSKTAEAVMTGDLSRRAPVVGSGDEFDRLAEQLNAMLARIEQLMQSSRHVGDSIAHDLRSPLTRLRNRLETTLAGPMSQGIAEETLEQTLGEVDGVLATFNAILRLSRLETGQGARMAATDLTALLGEIVELYEPACEEAGLAFSNSIGRNLTGLGQREMIAQAMSNLIDNAIKYTPEGGNIKLEAARGRDNMVVIRVIDSGPGIPKSERARAIERFVRLEDSRSEPGSGLGLALVAAVAEVHNGTFELSDGNGSEDSPGLSATLRVPRA